MTLKLGPVHPTRKTGSEQFDNDRVPAGFDLLAFWQWSASDLLSNSTRGVLAEFLVACDLGVAGGVREEWAPYDLRTLSGVTVEVKSASYLQSWSQERLSRIEFSIAPSHGWNPKTGKYQTSRRRQADVYVFCLLDHRDKQTIDPMRLNQWSFLVLPTSRLNEDLGDQKRLSLARLRELHPTEVKFGEVGRAIDGVFRGSSGDP